MSGAVQCYEMFYEILLVGGEHHVVTMFMMNGFNCVVKINICILHTTYKESSFYDDIVSCSSALVDMR